jgi:hypothetical protein
MARNKTKKHGRQKLFQIHNDKASRGSKGPNTAKMKADVVGQFFIEIYDACLQKNLYFCSTNQSEASFVSSRVREESFDHYQRKALCRLIMWSKWNKVVLYRKDLLTERRSLNINLESLAILVNLAKCKNMWIKEPEKFRVKNESLNGRENSYLLAHHLLGRYEVPYCLNKVWDHSIKESKIDRQRKEWYHNLARGENIRKQDHLPIPLTKKAAHLFSSAPHNLYLMQSFRWAQLKALGMEDRVINGVMSTPLDSSFDNDDFWQTVIRFFSDNPFLDTAQYREIYDYIYTHKFLCGTEFINGYWANIPPEQPNFSMKNRDPHTLLQLVEAWHAQLRTDRINQRHSVPVWESCGIPPYAKKEEEDFVQIVELTTCVELKDEGKAMRHCVYSYADSCAKKRCAIFSLRLCDKNNNVLNRYATIEVSLAQGHKKVVQIRKVCNKNPTAEDMGYIRSWAKKNSLNMSKWIEEER